MPSRQPPIPVARPLVLDLERLPFLTRQVAEGGPYEAAGLAVGWTGWRQSGAQRAPRVFSGVPFGRQPEDFQGAKARAVNQVSIGLGSGVSDTCA
jgi:hypothetical protein